MKEVIFKSKKENHFYAQRNDKGQLELIQEPQAGQKYYEFACVSGGMV
jgi:hypothetical protein